MLELKIAEFKELKKFKKEIDLRKKQEIVEDYEIKRESNEYSLILECPLDVRYLVNAGRCSYNNKRLEIVGQYESIQMVLLKLEKERIIKPYILGMIYADLWNLREKCLYVERKKNKLIIYSDYSLDTYIKYKSWESIKESPANKLLKYIIKTDNNYKLLKELESEFFIQEI